MRRSRSIWGIVLCLGLAGCAGTQQRAVFGPGNGAGGQPVLANAHVHAHSLSTCGCGPVKPPVPFAVMPSPPVAMLALRQPEPLPAARFFPLFYEGEGARADPRESPRADWLGVRTTLGNEKRVTPVLRDRQMERTSASTEEQAPALPLVMRIAVPRDVPEGDGLQAPVTIVAEEPFSPSPGTEALPSRGGAIGLEYVDNPALAGRPRLGNDGSVIPGRQTVGDKLRYGPDPIGPTRPGQVYYAPRARPRCRCRRPARSGLSQMARAPRC